ncbi:centrosomal protein of 97 kDa isoform X3 [Hermetia illucens]|uniref:centrosomal protein of 97 kDa isoform X3 n=1 Tax=Hermetia illucens TaxID=343691 RepID=UPI0018CC463F|nr:centrosomal protein of 97 kDa isoform X3 [Hermetia illucens]
MNDDDMDKSVLDLSKKCLKKVPKQDDAQQYRVLILDDNELQKIDNIDSYSKIEKLSLSKNQLLRMYGVCRLHCLREINLSFNGILTIEGLKELVHLTHLNLEGNNIKTIEHLNTNTKLEYLNLSENSIGSISDISFLKCLKELYLHGNRLTHLRQCDKYLPLSLETLTLAKNNISDLNEICTLANLSSLHNLTINENPCVQMTAGTDGFDHRPFVLNWCMTLKTIDGFVVDPIESLKAEWLYSQGRGRQFRVGEQANLARYLSSVCPLLGKALENENERKLRLILSKAQQHQRQLQEEISENVSTSGNNSPSSGRRKPSSRIQSPRSVSRLSGRQGSPDSMSNSYHGNTSSSSFMSGSSETLAGTNIIQMTTSLIENIRNDTLMTQSLDGSNVAANNAKKTNNSYSQDSTARIANQHNDPTPTQLSGGPLVAASKMVPVPETLMSPDVCPSSTTPRAAVTSLNTQHYIGSSPSNKSFKGTVQITPPDGSSAISSDDDSDHINVDKLKTIRNKAAQRSQQQKENLDLSSVRVNEGTELSAIIIQKTWRGYYTRKKTKDMAEKIMKKRTQEYINKLSKDMELTKAQLENERKIQQLQMQAINALWKKVSNMQSASNSQANNAEADNPHHNAKNSVTLDNSSTAVVADLAKTCSLLTNQVQQLQGSMRDIVNCMTLFCGLPQDSLRKALNINEQKDSSGTQTEIVAVHTPQVEGQGSFPFKIRPSSLPLEAGENTSQKLTNEVISEKDDTSIQEKAATENTEITPILNHDGSGEGDASEHKLNTKNLLNSSHC